MRNNRGTLVLCTALLVLFIASVTGCRDDDSAPVGSAAVRASEGEPSRVTVAQVREWMQEDVPLTFLDSRNAGSWRTAETKLPGALRVPASDLSSHISEIPREGRIIVYCT